MADHTQRSRTWRLVAVAAVVVTVLALGWAFDLQTLVTVERLRALTASAGAWGVLAFLAAFALGSTIGVPPLVFVLAALVSYGLGPGLAVAFTGGLLGATATFFSVRLASGRRPPPKNRVVARVMGTLERCPVATVALLRALFMLSLSVSVALSLSRVRYRDYLAGTALGLVAPLAFYAFTLDCWVR